MTLGDRIKQKRAEKGLTQEELAQRLRKKHGLKTDRVMISKWESDFQVPQITALKCLANELDTSLDFLNDTEHFVSERETLSLAESSSPYNSLSPDERYLLSRMEHASDDQVAQIRKLVDVILGEDVD